MNNEIIFIVEESLGGGYDAKALGYNIYTQADSIETLREMIKDSIECHFDAEEKPGIIRLRYVKEEVFAA